MPFEGFKAIDKNGHSHQNDYVLTYKGNSVEEITNTIMFNINDNQVNYITVQLDGDNTPIKRKKLSLRSISLKIRATVKWAMFY